MTYTLENIYYEIAKLAEATDDPVALRRLKQLKKWAAQLARDGALTDEGTKSAVENYPIAWLILYQRPGSPKGMLDVVYHGHNAIADYRMIDPDAKSQPLYAAPVAAQSQRIVFPLHLRKMWSGTEVQEWLDEQMGAHTPKPSAKGSLERYRQYQHEQAKQPVSGADGLPSDTIQGAWAAACRVAADIARDAWVNHVHATGLNGMYERCKQMEQVLLQEAERYQPQSSGNAAHPIPQQLRDAFSKIEDCSPASSGMQVFTEMRTTVQAFFQSYDHLTNDDTKQLNLEAAARVLVEEMKPWDELPKVSREFALARAKRIVEAALAQQGKGEA